MELPLADIMASWERELERMRVERRRVALFVLTDAIRHAEEAGDRDLAWAISEVVSRFRGEP